MPKISASGGATHMPEGQPVQDISARAAGLVRQLVAEGKTPHQIAVELNAMGENLPRHYTPHAAAPGGNGWWHGAAEEAIAYAASLDANDDKEI